MNENEMWKWLQDTTITLSRKLISNRDEADDIASDVMLFLLQRKSYAEKLYHYGQKKADGYKYGNSGVLVKLIQEEYVYHRIGQYFNESRKTAERYSVIYMQILDVCKKYNIQPIPQNAYLIAYGTGIANIDIIEKILKTVIPQQVDIEKLQQYNKRTIQQSDI